MRAVRISASIGAILFVLAAGCSKSGQSSNTLPSSPTSSSLDAFVGSWTSPSVAGGSATPAGCSDLKYDIARAADNQSANVTFSGTCSGITVAGTGSGSLSGSTLTWSASGTASRGTLVCAFDFRNNTATPEGTNAIRVNYAGTVCGFSVSGSQVFTRK